MLPIRIIHHPPLKQRKEYLLSQDFGGFAEFYEHSIYKPLYIPDPKEWGKKCDGLYESIPPYRELAIGDQDCVDKHYRALTDSSYLKQTSLILEDDAIILPNFWETIKKFLSIPDRWDICILGGAFPHTVAPTVLVDEDYEYYLKGNPATNTACSYIVHPNVAALIAHDLFRGYTLPIDYELNYIIQKRNLTCVHPFEYCVKEGSSAGYYQRSQIR